MSSAAFLDLCVANDEPHPVATGIAAERSSACARRADMAEEGLDVAACIEDVRRGDEAAARALMQHLRPTVAKIVRANLPRRTGEEDLMQMVFIKIFTRLHQFSGTVPLHHWASRVAVNECLAQIAKERVRPEVRWADLSEQHEEVLTSLMRSEEDLPPGREMASREIVEQLLSGLSPKDKLVITLLHLEERTLQEVHEITGWNIPVIKVRAFRARLKLKRRYEILIKQLQ